MKHSAGPEDVPELQSRLLRDDERYYYEQSYKEPVESIARIEDTAKFLIGAAATTSGIFLAAFQLSVGNQTVSGTKEIMPFIFWALSILGLILVLFPHEYRTGKNEPASWREAFLQARKRKYRWLIIGAVLFVAGVISAAYPLIQ